MHGFKISSLCNTNSQMNSVSPFTSACPFSCHSKCHMRGLKKKKKNSNNSSLESQKTEKLAQSPPFGRKLLFLMRPSVVSREVPLRSSTLLFFVLHYLISMTGGYQRLHCTMRELD